MASDRRLVRLRALVDRIERLPASERREWMLEEARARLVDVETGVEPRPMRSLVEGPPPEPPQPRVSNGRAVKRPRSKPAPPAAPRRQGQPETPSQDVRLPVPAAAPPRIAGREASADTCGDDELLWLDDRPDHTVADPSDDATEIAPWRRGLRG